MENLISENLPELTFDQLPAAVQKLSFKLDAIERLLHTTREPITDPDKWFDIDELIEYLPEKPAKPTIYGYVGFRSIPFYKSGKRLRFLKSEIDLWLKSGRRKTIAETDAEAEEYINNKKGLHNGK